MTCNLKGKRSIEFHRDETWCMQLAKAMKLEWNSTEGIWVPSRYIHQLLLAVYMEHSNDILTYETMKWNFTLRDLISFINSMIYRWHHYYKNDFSGWFETVLQGRMRYRLLLFAATNSCWQERVIICSPLEISSTYANLKWI